MFPLATCKHGRTRVENCLENKMSNDYKDKTKAFSDNCSGTQSDILFFVNSIFSCKQHYAFKVG